ncbi:DUF1488 domain-containing protein [Labrys miyagiensis]|uniref:DUF1488 domain-containing protein n=1 Tax=Labrys miyagiensis TaxID=346912 RepID=UPI0024E0B828|nr:DUF1488 domain-containing protein [Labrys miyagiensis]
MISFPNISRNYQASKQSVCFWGYDSAFEISFFVGRDMLERIAERPSTSEADLLQIFDTNRPQIQEVAAKAYSPRRGNYYSLESKDF